VSEGGLWSLNRHGQKHPPLLPQKTKTKKLNLKTKKKKKKKSLPRNNEQQ